MKIFGDLNFLDRGDEPAAPPEESLPSPQLVESDSPGASPDGFDLSDELEGSEPGADHYAAAVRFYLRGQLDEALAELEHARSAGEDLAEVYTAMAQIYLERKDFVRAIESYREFLAIDPNNGAAQFNLGLALEATEQYEEARHAFQAAIQFSPDLTESYLGLAGTCLKLNDSEGAREAYQAYLKVDPDSFTAAFGLGVACQLSEDYEKAVEHYVVALHKNPESEEVLTNLAGVYTKTGNFQDAENCFRQLLKVRPDSAKAYEGLAYTHYRQGRFDEALEQYRQVVKSDPDSYSGWYNLGLACQKKEQYQDAVGAYKKGLQIQHDSIETHLNLAACYQELGKTADAQKLYESVLEFDPNSLPALYSLAVMYERNQQWDNAVAFYDKVAEATSSPAVPVGHGASQGRAVETSFRALRKVYRAQARVGRGLVEQRRRLPAARTVRPRPGRLQQGAAAEAR
jgi:tetratricopeptide (TPR) repeat protein